MDRSAGREGLLRNRYRVLERLGSGGAGTVFVVEDVRGRIAGGAEGGLVSDGEGGPRLALKALFEDREQAVLLAALKQEFRALATLRHPSIARVYDFGSLPKENGLPGSEGRAGHFFTRELVSGDDLLSACLGLDPALRCRACQKTALALDVLHRAGMVHGDLKPQNIIVDRRGEPHLIDFGLAMGEGTGSLRGGTMAYLAPECLERRTVDRRADLYALGIVLFQLLTGHLPLPGATLGELVTWHLHGEPPRLPPELGFPARLHEVLRRLTERDRDLRFPSAAEAAIALGEAAELLGAPPLPTPPAPFVPPAPGDELTGLLRDLEGQVRTRLLEGGSGPSLLCVRGEAGSGKSTLLTELAWRCQLEGIEVLRGAFQPRDLRVQGPLGDIMGQVAGLLGKANPLGEGSEDAASRYAVAQQIGDFLLHASLRWPLLLLLDDGSQAGALDRAVLRFLHHALPSSAAVMVVLAARPDEALDEDLGQVPSIQVPPLPPEAVARMAAEASGRSDPELAQALLAHTAGNPLFLQVVLRRLSEHGWPARADLARLAPPDSLEQVYRRRWEALGPDEQKLLQALAVLGRPAAPSVLEQLLDETGDGSERPRATLTVLGLRHGGWLDLTPEGLCIFERGPAATRVDAWLPESRRQDLHRACMRVLGRTLGSDAVERTRHAIGAADSEAALDTLEAALSALRRLGAHGRGLELSQGLLRILPEASPWRPRLLGIIGRLHRAAGELDAAYQALHEATTLLDGEEALEARIDLGAVHREAGRAEAAATLLSSVLEGPLPDRLRLAALAELAAAQMATDQHDHVLSTVAQALALARGSAGGEVGDPGLVARLRGQLAWSLGYLQRPDEAEREFLLALKEARASGSKAVEAGIQNSRAVAAYRLAEYSRVGPLYEEALRCADEARDLERQAAIRFNLATFHLSRGDYGEALRHQEQSLRLFEAMGAHKSIAAARCNHGFIQLRLGLVEQARSTLLQAVAETRRVGKRSGEALALLLLAQAEAGRGGLQAARDGIREARRLYLDVGQRRDAADALLDLAQIELDAGEADAARMALSQAEADVDLDKLPDLCIRRAVLAARLATQDPDRSGLADAGQRLSTALKQAESLESPELLWECHAAGSLLADAEGRTDEGTRQALLGERLLQGMSRGLPAWAKAAFWQDPRRQAVRHRAALAQPSPRGSLQGPRPPTLPSDRHLPDTLFQAQEPADSTAPTSHAAAGSVGLPSGKLPQVARVEERFYRLLEIYRQVNAELDRDRLLGLVMDTAVELTGAERGFLLLGNGPDSLRVEVARNLSPDGEGGVYSRSIAERVVRSGEPLVTVSAHTDPRFQEYRSVHQLRLESVLCIPIHAQDRVAGALYMESRFQSGRFSPDDQRLLMAFGDQVAIALTNARLLQENIRKAEELERANLRIEALADERLRLLDQRTRQLEEARRDLDETRRSLESRGGMFGMVGRSDPMMRLYHLIERVAGTDVPVLLEGESGTGKEMVARAIHNAGERRALRLVSVNCAAIPEGLLESELFGHVRGAFTGAERERKGLFVAAHGGTLFLDEIGDMPRRMQVDLLRALQEKTIRPVGGQKDIQVDVRVIAASNKPLTLLVQQGRFREDLFYRLNVVCLRLPPLRERPDDIPLLVDHFLQNIADQMKQPKKRLTRSALRKLSEHPFPGNVRQLEHTLMNAAVLADSEVLDEADLSLDRPSMPREPAPEPGPTIPPGSEKERREREHRQILDALEATAWNKTRAARLVNMPRRTFYRRLKEYGIA